MFCRSLASLTVNFLFSLSEATVILLVAVSVGALSPSPTTDSVFPNETSLSSPVFPANLSTFPSTYAFTTLLLASLDPSILVSPSFSTHLSSVILLASTFAYSVAIFVVPANDFILDSSRLSLYVVFVLFVVSGVTVIPEPLSLLTSTASFAISCTLDFFTDIL